MHRFLTYLLFLLCLAHPCFAQQYSVADLPNPKDQGQEYYVSNPDGILSGYATDSINQLLSEIDRLSSAEVSIVVIQDFVGDDDFEYAFQVFQSWGIGKSENDNGLLLLIAKNRQTYRFISGYGVEGLLPDALLKRIGETYLVPFFREGQFDEGVLTTAKMLHDVLISPEGVEELTAKLREELFWVKYWDDLTLSGILLIGIFAALRWIKYVVDVKVLKGKSKTKFPTNWLAALGGCGCSFFIVLIIGFTILFLGIDPNVLIQMHLVPLYIGVGGSLAIFLSHSRGVEFIKKSFRDEKNRQDAIAKYNSFLRIHFLLSPLTFITTRYEFRQNEANKARFLPPDQSGDWERLDRDELKKSTSLLDKGQLKEEKELSRSYELWKHRVTGAVQAIGWAGTLEKNFSACPECGYLTFEKPAVRTIKAATYQATGIGSKSQRCVNCAHKLDLGEVTIPKKVRSSSSSGGSGGGSSRSSGSFGGGSSGGGGAGGRW